MEFVTAYVLRTPGGIMHDHVFTESPSEDMIKEMVGDADWYRVIPIKLWINPGQLLTNWVDPVVEESSSGNEFYFKVEVKAEGFVINPGDPGFEESKKAINES